MDIAKLFEFAHAKNASDLILKAGSPPTLRIDGEMRSVKTDALTAEQTKQLIYATLNESQVKRFEADHELDFSLFLMGPQHCRGNVFLQRGLVGAAFRLIPQHLPKLAELGLPPVIEELCMAPQGLILVTGPTGHGKSTTQAAMIDVINERRHAHVVTVEDPLEFIHESKKSLIEQREVGLDTKSFAEALRHVLRQAPDVILIGEIRDRETVSIALTAAETGHLVITTLHTNDALQSIDRLVDVYPPHQQSQVRSQLALCLLAVIAQRLLPRADGKGRVLAIELLLNNAASANLIREGKTFNIYTVLETNASAGMCTMDASLRQLCLQGIVTREEARRRMKNPDQLTMSDVVPTAAGQEARNPDGADPAKEGKR
ncbi:MAG: type IV pilus twitching motility protein PilT [Candidatus Brocadiia bacterium]